MDHEPLEAWVAIRNEKIIAGGISKRDIMKKVERRKDKDQLIIGVLS